MKSLLFLPIFVLTFLHVLSAAKPTPPNLKKENLAAWCIVPFDSKKRNPEERAKMLVDLGITKSAYDWRSNHVMEFEEEILQYKKHGIEFFAFWSSHPEAFKLFKKHKISPQIWRTLGSPKSGTQEEKVEAAAKGMAGLAKQAEEIGSQLGLYNHGGWGGEPENMVAVCKKMREMGHENVGIVYNWHHGHGHIDDWAASLQLMQPYLLCLNLNGMNTGAQPKILTLGQGEHDARMLQTVIESGYDGPIGILDHQSHLDAALVLEDNLQGLNWLLQEWNQKGSGGKRPTPKAQPSPARKSSRAIPPSSPTSVDGPEGFGKALAGGIAIEGKAEWREPPITVEFQALMKDSRGYNILVASDTKSSNAHWEIFSMNGNGRLTVYMPGVSPDHIHSKKVVTDGKWHRIAMQYSSEKVKLWVDGEVVADQAIKLKSNRRVVPGPLGLGRLAEGHLGLRGAIDEVRIRQGLYEPFKDEGKDLGNWDFEDLKHLKPFKTSAKATPKSAQKKTPDALRIPLEPKANPYWQEYINRDRIYDFYAKQALKKDKNPVAFPGLDGGYQGHWGNQNDQVTWKDGRVRDMDHGLFVSGVFRGTGKTIPRAISVRLENGFNAVFNTDTLRFEVAWKGDLVKWSDVRRGFMHGIPMGGEKVELENFPETKGEYLGLHRVGSVVQFAYAVNGVTKYKNAFNAYNKKVVVGVSEVKGQNASEYPQYPVHEPKRIKTKGKLGTGAPYAIDTLTLPFENPDRALFFVGGLDFLSPTRIAICNIHGDVWLCDMKDSDLSELTWTRFATGLHQPLGLKVVDGVIHVLGRDQITALIDVNGDDFADFYKPVSRAYQTSPGGHSFITGLQRDNSGRWYTASGNQGLCQISADGKSVKVMGTGFRNPNGLSISPDGKVVLTSVQEGSWTPASAICDVSIPGHFGAGGPRKGERGYVPPMLYLPRGADNSSGGQTYIDSDQWGPVKGQWVHYSSGFAKHFLVLREEYEGGSQAAAVALPGSFSSGAHRGRFSPSDGQLYVAGSQGWGSYGLDDGSLQRVRFTGDEKGYPYPTSWETRDNGILLTFASSQSKDLTDHSKWFAQQWNYRYSPSYGSTEYSVADPNKKGHDFVGIRSVHKIENNQYFVEIPQLQPVNQLHLHYNGTPRLEIFATLHKLGQPFTDFKGYQPITKTFGIPKTLPSIDSKDPETLMAACTTCHHETNKVVGPPLVDIRKRYVKNPAGIVKWAMNPINKNPQMPPMPPFKFLGEDKLMIIAKAILKEE